MNNVIHVVHAKLKSVLFTIAIPSLVDAIHHPILQLESAAQYLSSPLILSRVLKHTLPRTFTPQKDAKLGDAADSDSERQRKVEKVEVATMNAGNVMLA